MAKKKYTFVITDESKVDSDGERFLVKGIDLSRMKTNGVCMFIHERRWKPTAKFIVIGKWSNFRIEGTKLLADVEFDSEDPDAAEIERKVKKGYLKSCSPYYRPTAFSDDPADKLKGQTGLTFTKSVIIEISIVDIPANENALLVKSLDDESPSIKELLKSFNKSTDPKPTAELPTPAPETAQDPNNHETMDKEVLKALGLDEDASSALALATVEKLKSEKAAAEEALEKNVEAEAQELAGIAVEKGLFTEDQKGQVVDWFKASPEMAKTFVGAGSTARSVKDEGNKGSGKQLSEGEQGKLNKFLSNVTDKGEVGSQGVKKYSEMSDEEIEKLEDDERETLMKAEGII